jgi:hypothetical protein
MSKFGEPMARNTGGGFHRGSVDDRTQVLNPTTGIWSKRDQRLVAALAPGERVEVEAPDTGEIFDIDTPDDLAGRLAFRGGDARVFSGSIPPSDRYCCAARPCAQWP